MGAIVWERKREVGKKRGIDMSVNREGMGIWLGEKGK